MVLRRSDLGGFGLGKCICGFIIISYRVYKDRRFFFKKFSLYSDIVI